MAFVEWTDSERVQVTEMDTQHERIANLLNSLYSLLGSGKKMASKQLLSDLERAVRIHFDSEESAMKKHGWKNYISHKMEHDRFYRNLVKFNAEVQEDKNEVNLEFLNSCKKWLFNHFRINDKKLGLYLYEKGER